MEATVKKFSLSLSLLIRIAENAFLKTRSFFTVPHTAIKNLKSLKMKTDSLCSEVKGGCHA